MTIPSQHAAPPTRADEDLVRVREAIARLDLSLVKKKVATETDWCHEKIEQVAAVYKRFLFLCFKYPGVIVATRDVDAFWHRHILDTKQYARDCETIFGFFLHHDPHALNRDRGLTKAILEERFQATHRLYEDEFAERSFDVYMAGCDDCIPCYDPPSDPDPQAVRFGSDTAAHGTLQ